MLRLVLFSTVRLFGDALAVFLQAQQQISEVAYCHTAMRLVEDVAAFGPDAVLFDLNGESVLQEARAVNSSFPETPLLAIAISETPDTVLACADAGFSGYVPRHASIKELFATIDMVIKGECACHPRIAGSLLREVYRRRQPGSDSTIRHSLTRRESEILSLLGRGHSNKEIARELNVSLATVKNHVHSVLQKMGVARRSEAVSRLRDEPWLAHSA